MSAQTVVRELEQATVPEAGRWDLDPSHTTAAFSVRHMGFSKVHGHFQELSGHLTVTDDVEDSAVEARIAAASITTGDDDRDTHLKSSDFLDVEQHPELVFRSTGVRQVDGDRWEVQGELTIRGTTRPVTLDTHFEGGLIDPWEQPRVMLSATTKLNREDFGLTWNMALEAGGVLVGKEVEVTLEIQAVRAE